MVNHTPASALLWISFPSIRPFPLSCCVMEGERREIRNEGKKRERERGNVKMVGEEGGRRGEEVAELYHTNF